MNRGGDGIDPDPSGRLAEVTAIHGISIAQQMAWLVTPRCRFDHLTPDPGRGRVRGHVDVHQLAPTVGDEDQHVEGLEREGLYGEQIRGPEMVGMIGQERAPGLA